MSASKKATFETYVVGALLVLFGVTLASSLKRMGLWGAPQRAQPAAVAVIQAAPPSPQSVAAISSSPGETLYTAHTLRDPLISLLPKEPEPAAPVPSRDMGMDDQEAWAPPRPPQVTVQGLWWGDEKPKAIINGQIYGIGDQVDGAVITAIGRQGVTVDVHGESMRLTTSPPASSGSGAGAFP